MKTRITKRTAQIKEKFKAAAQRAIRQCIFHLLTRDNAKAWCVGNVVFDMAMTRDHYDIFLSYFRTEAGIAWTGFLKDRLEHGLFDYRIFKDDEETPAGAKWKPRLKKLVRGCSIFILVITEEWSGEEIQAKLISPENWVRKEILTALQDKKKKIIPVCLNGAQLPRRFPEDLRSAINDNQCYFFSRGTKNWDREVGALCCEITGEPCRSGAKSNGKELTKLFAGLDRATESSRVRSAALNGTTILLICADDSDGPWVFAQRCGIDVGEDPALDQEFTFPHRLDWMKFQENIDPKLRIFQGSLVTRKPWPMSCATVDLKLGR